MNSLQSVKWFVFAVETLCVLCDLRYEFFKVIYFNFIQPDFIVEKILYFRGLAACELTERFTEYSTPTKALILYYILV
jgi:hypothetical protein